MTATRALRGATFVALTALITLAPSARQLFGWRQEWLRPWVMFAGSGLDATEVRFMQRDPEGKETPLDRYALLAEGDPDAQAGLRRVKDAPAAQRIAASLCRKIGPHPDVRVYMREATRQGWKRTLRGDRNLCEKQ